MKERPILFSAPMVRAIIEGRKTQTRRIVKPQPYVDEMGNACWNGRNFGQNGRGVPNINSLASPLPRSNTKRVLCPFGAPGDRLWVRESFQPLFAEGVDDHHEVNWKTGKGYAISYPATDGVQEYVDADDNIRGAVKPSIHMPRWASRITLEITGVRVERLQDISDAGAQNDCTAEGVYHCGMDCPTYEQWHGAGFRSAEKFMYRALWESINGAGSWAANPFVWAIEFRRIGS